MRSTIYHELKGYKDMDEYYERSVHDAVDVCEQGRNVYTITYNTVKCNEITWNVDAVKIVGVFST